MQIYSPFDDKLPFTKTMESEIAPVVYQDRTCHPCTTEL